MKHFTKRFDIIKLMLQKQYRLKNKYAFKATYRLRNIVANENLILYVGKPKQNESMPTKVGFVVSNKIHKRAVKRNRIRRLVRESYRLLLKENKIPYAQKYVSLIFMVKQNSLNADFKNINRSVVQLIDKLSQTKV